MRILLLSRYGQMGASSRYRAYQYIPYLSSQGFDITVSELLGDWYLRDQYSGKGFSWPAVLEAYFRRVAALLDAKKFDLIWVEKEFFPWIPDAVIERLFKGFKYVVDYDDAVFHRYDGHPNPLVRKLLSRSIDHVMLRSSLVIAGNDYLAERARASGARQIEVLPTVIDISRYKVAERKKKDIFTVGWIGTPATSKYLRDILPALQAFSSQGGIRVVAVGAGNISLDGVPLEVRPWSETTEVNDISEFDVGIMPLSDTPWERGKCGFKLIQYMGCGLPVIGTPIGVNDKLIVDNENGFKALTTEDWIRGLNALRENPIVAYSYGDRGRELVESNYSLQVAAPRLANLFHCVVDNRSN